MTVRDDVQHVAALLARPRSGYARRVEAAQSALSPQACEALRQLGMFVDRVGDLSTDELRELYDETFRRGRPAAIEPLVARLARQPTGDDDAREALRELTPLLERLDADRNPFAHVVRSLCCRLLDRTRTG
jgi:nitrate reductase assembly molybdenum cofactor insertion protein NarJ